MNKLKNIKLLGDFLTKYPKYKTRPVYHLLEVVSDIIRKRISNNFVGFHRDDIELFINPSNFSYNELPYPSMSIKHTYISDLFEKDPFSFIENLKKLV